MKAGVLVFPGSNCDRDCEHVLNDVFHIPTQLIWHKDTSLPNLDLVVIPGGFSYGDYLRCGAIAKFSPVMKAVIEFANKGGKVLGICNGFQILVESGLLPGVLLRNQSLKFICETVNLKLVNTKTPFTGKGKVGQVLAMPIAHAEGNYYNDADGIKKLWDQNQVVFQYEGQNPNGSLDSIAGICSEKGNVLGLMPHPERVCESLLGGTDGKLVFESLL